VITKFSLEKSSSESSESDSSLESEESEEGSIELTEKIFEEEEIKLPYKNI
jgi:hypothetical protein